jgi:hypothetical protein
MERKTTMEEKLIDNKNDQEVVDKKIYTPPVLQLYGKLIELTEGNNGTNLETLPQGTIHQRRP